MDIQNQDEHTLVLFAKQHPDGFAQLYNRYFDRIFAYVRRQTADHATAEDIVAVTFTKAYQNLPGYQWRGTSFGAWLYKIARNELRMHARKQKWLSPFFITQVQSPQNVEREVQHQETVAGILGALNTLPPKDQEILRLCYFEELSTAEIAEVLDCSMSNVAVRRHRALKRLRRQMNTQDIEKEIASHVPSK